MRVAFSMEQRIADVDDSLREAADTNKPGEAITLRLQPQIRMRTPGAARPTVFLSWKGLSWNLKVATVEEGQQLRQALQKFFAALGRVGAAEVSRVLDELEPDAVESALRNATADLDDDD